VAFENVMDAFHTFDNVAGFYIGDEVVTMANGSAASPYVKAATRDLKAYRDHKNYRPIPIGYSAADIASLRPMLQNYLACGDASSAIEFFSLNAYEWCGDNTYISSGYAALTEDVTAYPIPIFFSETGCITIRPRTFSDQAAIFGPQMSPYWSGAVIYEWIQEDNNYGIIQYGPHVDPASPGAPPDGWPRAGAPQPLQPEFGNLQQQWANATPSGVAMAAYAPSAASVACPGPTPGVWNVDPKAPLPPVPQGGVNYGVDVPSASSSSASTSSGAAKSFAGKTAAPPTTALAAVAVTVISSALGWRGGVPALVLLTICWIAVGNVMV
jgi:1,3-beta-glucanosyltransferase GAS1